MVPLKGIKQGIDMIILFLKISVGLKFREWIEGQEWGGGRRIGDRQPV